MLKLRALLPAFALILFVAAASSQENQPQPGRGVGSGTGSGSGSGGIISIQPSTGFVGGIITGFGSGDRGTKGQPFSADVVDENDRYLADGNHIHREMHGKIFRDSQGRTRTETELDPGGPRTGEPFVHVVITDPVQGQFIVLDPRQKQATVHAMGPFATPGSGAQPAGTPAQANALPQELLEKRQQADKTAPRPRTPSFEDLGTTEMEGFTVTGTRFSRTIPAGARGNDKPITTTSERWFSSDLQMALLTKSESPESGTHTRKVINIRSGEPDPLLFQVPADYTVQEPRQ
jgi:hypothetical protein